MKKNFEITPIILAGGSGTRLWPLSRNKLPKQFHVLYKNKTMLQHTIELFNNMNVSTPIIICNKDHKYLVKDQIAEINKTCDILIEPFSKNTAPAIALAALYVKPDTTLLVLSADHKIQSKKKFREKVKEAFNYSSENKIVAFGVKPTNPNINYGYIRTIVGNDIGSKILNFEEKPNISKAKIYFKNKEYFWNSGIFLFKSDVFLSELETFNPKILKYCKKTFKSLKVDKEFKTFDDNIFSKVPNISIDYAIMEYTKIGIMVPLNTNWSDIGTWKTLMDISKKNKQGNLIKGNVITENSRNSIIFSMSNKTIVSNSIKDLTIIDTKNALLVSSTNETDNLKKLVEKIKKKKPEIIESALDENRPWGSFEVISQGLFYKVKKIIVKPDGQLSLQKHKFRSEHWVVVSGKANVIKGTENFILNVNESTYIPNGVIHSLKNEGRNNLVIIEVQTGNYLGEDDIERLTDIYHRN
jgi:mannose-1-phosphate guanylyltransferase/mannose-6-phosphate isomerase